MAVADKPRRDAKPSAAIKVKVDLKQIQAKKSQHRYILGTRKDCPIQNVDVAGVSFLRFSGGNAVFNSGMTANDARQAGAIRYGVFVPLTDEQVSAIQEGVSKKVVRTMHSGRHRTGRILNTNKASYSASPNDEPLAKYLYMHRADAVSNADAETGDFEPMLQE